MDKREIVQALFKAGILVTPDILGRVTKEDIEGIIKSGDFVVERIQSSLTVQDYTTFLKEKYEGISRMLVEKGPPVSVSNSKNLTDVYLVGMVREHTYVGFLLEDPTGDIEVIDKNTSDKPGISDVVGVRGFVREGKIVMQELVYPDIPIPKEVKRFKKNIVLKGKELEIEAGGKAVKAIEGRASLDGIDILVFEGDGDPKDWLKKRHLPGQIRGPRDNYIIENIPDILWAVGKSNSVEFYKGVMIVKGGKDGDVRVNMFTKEVDFL